MMLEIILAVLIFFLVIYKWITKSFDKWKQEGIAHDEPTFPFGTHNILAQKHHLIEHLHCDYQKFKIGQKLKVHGWFLFGKPALSINDVEILKQIQVKDFNHFVDRNEANTTRALQGGGRLDKLWALQLANACGDKWKDLRSTFTPVFTSGKMKLMLGFIKTTASALVEALEDKADAGIEFELKETFGKFSLDALASCAFGVDGQSFEKETSLFVDHTARIFQNTTLDNLLLFAKFIPGVVRFQSLFNINTFKTSPTRYLSEVIRSVLRTRRNSGERRGDMVDLMLDCVTEVGKVQENNNNGDFCHHETDMQLDPMKKRENMTEDDIVATALVVLVAGYDTTGMTLSFLAFEMTRNPDLQERLHREVDMAFEKNDGKMPDFAVIQNLPFLDMLIHETLRFHNPVGMNTRTCTKDYALPGTDVTLRKDDLVTFSVMGLHRDPEHFSHPDQFYPDHFSQEEKATRHP